MSSAAGARSRDCSSNAAPCNSTLAAASSISTALVRVARRAQVLAKARPPSKIAATSAVHAAPGDVLTRTLVSHFITRMCLPASKMCGPDGGLTDYIRQLHSSVDARGAPVRNDGTSWRGFAPAHRALTR